MNEAKEFLEQNGIPDRPIFGRKPKGQMPEYSANLSELMEEYANQSKWISVEDRLPDELQTVWALNKKDKFIALACLFYDDGWLWAVSNGTIYLEYGKIVSECDLDDEYEFTHWQPLPEAP